MAWPKGKPRGKSAAVQEPEVSAERHETPRGDERAVYRGVPDVRDGSRPQPNVSEGTSEDESDGAEAAGSGNAGASEAGQEDICLTDWQNAPMEYVLEQLQRLRDNVERAGAIIQARITSAASSTCAYCGKIIVDHAKAFSRMTNRNPKTGVLVTTDVCTEQCYRGYRARETGGDVSYAAT